MKALAIGRVNLLRFTRDRSNVFFVFVLPLGIILLIGAQFGGSSAPRLGLVDGGTDVGRAVAATLDDDDRIEVVSFADDEELARAIERGEVEAGVSVGTGAPVDARFGLRANANAGWMNAVVAEALARATIEPSAVAFAEQFGIDPARARPVAAQVSAQAPRLDVRTETVGVEPFAGVDGQFEIGAASQLVLFMFLTSLTGASQMIRSRDLGVTRRMLATATPRRTIVVGEALGRFAISVSQGLYIILVTAVAFGVHWGNPLSVMAVVVAFGAASAGAAMVIGTVFSNDQQAGGVSVLAGIGLGAIGGSMLPIELFSPGLRTVSRFTPHAWANEALADVMRLDASVIDIAGPLAVLLLFAAGFLAVAAVRLAP